MKTICLNMIVKNESAVIRRCIDSIKPLIDTWVIVDTGSTDGTQEAVRDALAPLPGTLYERPWVDFCHNRNEALQLARNKADYILFIDADEILTIDPPLDKNGLDKDSYLVRLIGKSVEASRLLLINNHPDWKWEGILHEYLFNLNQFVGDYLEGARLDVRSKDGCRSKDPNKYKKDAALLEAAHAKDPTDTRTVFYLAQTYLNDGQLQASLDHYTLRSQMGGWREEVFWSLYMIGLLQADLNMAFKTIVQSYTKAFEFEPMRAEPLYGLAGTCNLAGEHLFAYAAAKLALSLPLPQNNEMYMNRWIYQYGARLRVAESAFFLKCYPESIRCFEAALNDPALPDDIREIIVNNLANIRALA